MATVCNETENLNILQYLRYIAEWSPLESFFQKKTDIIYEFVMNKIDFSTSMLSKKKHKVYSYTPKHSGVCLISMIHFKNILVLRSVNAFIYYYSFFQS